MEMHAVHIQPERGTIVVISKIFKAVQVINRTPKPNDRVSHYILNSYYSVFGFCTISQKIEET